MKHLALIILKVQKNLFGLVSEPQTFTISRASDWNKLQVIPKLSHRIGGFVDGILQPYSNLKLGGILSEREKIILED